MSQNRGLGRGLGALIPGVKTKQQDGESIQAIVDIPLSKIIPNKNQPRHYFSDESLNELALSIREFGIIQPIIVRNLDKDGMYEIISGERRYKASKMAGLNAIPCIINQDIDDLKSLEMALIENIQRDNLTPIELSHTFKQLLEEFRITHEELSQKVGKSRAAITNSLRLLLLPVEIQKLIDKEKLSAGHARALLGIDDKERQIALAQLIIDKDLSVRETEKLIRTKSIQQKEKQKNTGLSSMVQFEKLPEVEKSVSTYLETPVSIKIGRKKGKIEILFGSVKDFERIVRKIIDNEK